MDEIISGKKSKVKEVKETSSDPEDEEQTSEELYEG